MSDTSETSDLYEITTLEGDVAITARNIRLYGSDVMSESGDSADTKDKTSQVSAVAGKLNLTADSLTITCTKSVKIAVGGNAISIDRNGIKLSSCKYTHTVGPFNANIQLDSLSGITMSGMSCTMKGYLTSTVADGMGASLKAAYGAAGIGGTQVSLVTTSPVNSTLNFVQFAGDFAADTLSSLEKETSTSNIVMVTFDQLAALHQAIARIRKASGQHTAWGWMTVICETLNTLIDIAVAEITASEALTHKSLTTMSVGDISLRDALRISASITKAGIAISTFFPMLAASFAAKSPLRSSTISLNTSKIELKSAAAESVTLSGTMANSVAAGAAEPLTGDPVVDALASAASKLIQYLASRISRHSVAGTDNLNPSEENTNLVQSDANAERQNASGVHQENDGERSEVGGGNINISGASSQQIAAQEQTHGLLNQAGGVNNDTHLMDNG